MHTKINNLQWMIAGEAGFGIKVTGQMFSRLCVRGGLSIFDYTEYPSLIRGGHNAFQVVVSDAPVRSPRHGVDLLIALNQDTLVRHRHQLLPGSGVLYDPDQQEMRTDVAERPGVRFLPVPLAAIARQQGGTLQMRNAVALGASVGLLNYDLALLESVLHTAFDRKGEAVVRQNLAAARAGFAFAEKMFSNEFPFVLKPVGTPAQMVMTGNTAVALGAIAAGCRFFAGYPMTPTTSILTYLAKQAERTGMVVRHMEDEIAAINAAVGASYAGVRTMVATAGGGFSLMVEGLGLAAMTETPLVIVVGQRPGPSTGMPTWTGQGDLQFVLHAGQDEFPRVVIAPGDPAEHFYATAAAFNFADRFQLPVFLLTDKFAGESHQSVDPFSLDHVQHDRGAVERNPHETHGAFARYRTTENGVSPRTLPGTPHGQHTVNSDEHDEFGAVTEEAAARTEIMQKRLRKIESLRKEVPPPMLYGPADAPLTLIGWGSTKGPMLDAMDWLSDHDIRVNVLHFVYLYPLPLAKLTQLLARLHRSLLIENNLTRQFGQQLQLAANFVPEAVLCKSDGRPFLPSDIVAKVHSMHLRTP